MTGFFLGPILNTLPTLLIAGRTVTQQTEKGLQTGIKPISVVGFQPLDTISANQGLLVIAAYTVVFAVTAIVLTWRRDVLE